MSNRGWLFTDHDAAEALERVGVAYVVAADHRVHVDEHEHAPVAAVMRCDQEHVELAARVATVEQVHAELSARVGDLGDRAEARDTDEGMELVTIKRRLRRLEDRAP